MVCVQGHAVESNSLKIVCYTGGTCGDLITALIDPTDVEFNTLLKTLNHNITRLKLKKPHLFLSNKEKDSYLQEISKQYTSIPSHDLEYHAQQNHSFISITVNDFDVALWAASRFKNCHRPNVWKEMVAKCGAESINDYAQILIDFSQLARQHTDKLVKLEDIKQGNVIEPLEKILDYRLPSTNKNIYYNWLKMQQGQNIA